MTMIWVIVLKKNYLASQNTEQRQLEMHTLSTTIYRAPIVGNLRNAKSRESSHISVSMFRRFSNCRCRLYDTPPLFFLSSIYVS
jgi:hypothetical protein